MRTDVSYGANITLRSSRRRCRTNGIDGSRDGQGWGQIESTGIR